MLAVAGDEIVVAYDLGANEATLKIRVDLAGCIESRRALAHGPCANFFRSSRIKRLQSEQAVGCCNHAVESRLLEPEIGKKLRLFVGCKLRELGFERSTDNDRCSAVALGTLAYGCDVRVIGIAGFGDVGDVHHGLGCDQVQLPELGATLGG